VLIKNIQIYLVCARDQKLAIPKTPKPQNCENYL